MSTNHNKYPRHPSTSRKNVSVAQMCDFSVNDKTDNMWGKEVGTAYDSCQAILTEHLVMRNV
jgi:hypothetical protein